MLTMATTGQWPALPVADWQDTRDTLQLYTQVVGKVRLANAPLMNHWWNVPLYVTARGLTTSLMPHPTGPAFQIDFDFVAHRLDIATVDGGRSGRCRSSRARGRLLRRGHGPARRARRRRRTIWPVPVEIAGAIPFPDDRVARQLRPRRGRTASGWRWCEMDRVFERVPRPLRRQGEPGAPVLGRPRPGRRPASPAAPAPPHPGGAPNCGPHVMREAYSHEVSSCGYWPGPPGEEGVFYAYAYPEPPGYRDAAVAPGGRALGRRASASSSCPTSSCAPPPDPDARAARRSCRRTYEAAATTAGWDRAALDRR